ncbi:hypothetical protein A3K80_09150 [Candidatus Bathyarchaeota archaeon RBG_13_38_9]|nr:MAG: hypothetical protein A3K80_09150 [Candidatus Bathyarchaeota archaeon RBG_13_38_9]
MININNGRRNKGKRRSNLFLVNDEWLSVGVIAEITNQPREKVRQAIVIGVISAEDFIKRYKTEKI